MISLLLPPDYEHKTDEFRTLSEITMHDLGLTSVVKSLSSKESEQKMILQVMSTTTEDARVTKYRCEVFHDIYCHEELCTQLMDILGKIDFLRDYGSFKREYEDTAAVWDLMHRLEELNDYIQYVEALFSCLDRSETTSEGLRNLKQYVQKLYHDRGFEELRQDIAGLKASTSNLKSVTLGVNLNERFEAESIGLVSVNSKRFTKSGIVGNFLDKISSKDDIRDDTEWHETMKYQLFSEDEQDMMHTLEKSAKVSALLSHPLLGMGLAKVPDGDPVKDVTGYMDRVTNHMLALTTRKLRQTLNQYVAVTITDITNIIPELIFYVRWAEYVKKMTAKGLHFSMPIVTEQKGVRYMHATGVFNLKLTDCESPVLNDLDFSDENCVYILTGANRGGKTTITQAIGQLFVLAQAGIYVPATEFEFAPIDCICTHFPADEDKTMDLGRLGEECSRFRELFFGATGRSLLLLNETFSTTSFEEGYYIAKDSVKALLNKGIRCIYNTHMHKLAQDLDEINADVSNCKGCSLVVEAKDGERSFKVKIAPPEGKSYAMDIAEKYGVTYQALMEPKH